MEKIDFKKLLAHAATVAKIISFISLVLSVVIKVRMLLSSSKINEEEKEEEESKISKTQEEDDEN